MSSSPREIETNALVLGPEQLNEASSLGDRLKIVLIYVNHDEATCPEYVQLFQGGILSAGLSRDAMASKEDTEPTLRRYQGVTELREG